MSDETADMMSETREGPTAHGGVRFVIYYRAANGDPAPKKDAARFEMVELDAGGKAIASTLGTMNQKEE